MASWPWIQALAVAVGAALGALLRWGATWAWSTPGSTLPLGTLVVNCAGGLLAGLALVWFQRTPHEALRLLCVTGFLGGLTTFSAFSAESLVLLQKGHYWGHWRTLWPMCWVRWRARPWASSSAAGSRSLSDLER